MDNNYLSVTELNTYIKQIVSSEDLLHRICVVGEISGLSLRGAHAYFTLKDENSQLRCCCFNYAKTYVPKDGELVLVYGSLDYYLKGGYLSYNAMKIEPYGQGLLAMRLEELKKRLREKGYFDESHKVAIPPFCTNIAVITSKDGAVLHDIVRTIRAKNYVSNIDFFDVKVQGIGCEKTIVDTLSKVDKLGYDVIIIARGGGSYEDLMGFNAEMLVYAIYDAVTPIISAVGHETDTTLCDFAADLRVPTPTAAGEMFAYDIAAMIESLESNIEYALSELKTKYSTYMVGYRDLLRELMMATHDKCNSKYSDLRLNAHSLNTAIDTKCNDIDARLISYMNVLSACNPASIMKRGYVGISDESGEAITSMQSLSVGENIMLRGADGSAKAEILSVNKD